MTLQTGSPVGERGLQWLDEVGPDYEIVLSTRVRLARNLQGQPFSVRCGSDAREQILEMSREALERSEVLDGASFWPITELEPTERAVLLERHLVSRELIGPPEGEPPLGAALVLAEDRTLGLMLNEEDHIRLQVLVGGLQLARAWREVDTLDDEFGARLPYAFHHEFGFLTSCPTNVGSGLRASVLVHLPGLVLTKEINKVLDGISQVGLTYRGLYGEGSEVIGNFFQISNQTTLGKTEEDLVEHLDKIVRRVIEYEKQSRAVLLREAPNVLEDKVWRAYGILRHARALSFDEMMNLLSGVRLGLTLKLLHTPRVESLNRIMIRAQTAHLARAARRRLDESDADVFRASLVRETFEADERAPGGNDDRPIDAGDDRGGGADGDHS